LLVGDSAAAALVVGGLAGSTSAAQVLLPTGVIFFSAVSFVSRAACSVGSGLASSVFKACSVTSTLGDVLVGDCDAGTTLL
jgi:hypothetical protein